MTTTAPTPPNDPRAELAMRKFMGILNEINAAGVHGFARMLDTANPLEMTELLSAADAIQRNLDRVKR